MIEITQKIPTQNRPPRLHRLATKLRRIPARRRVGFMFLVLAALLAMLPFHARWILHMDPDRAAKDKISALLEEDPTFEARLTGYGAYFTALTGRLPFANLTELEQFTWDFWKNSSSLQAVQISGLQTPPESFFSLALNSIASNATDLDPAIQRAAQSAAAAGWLHNFTSVDSFASLAPHASLENSARGLEELAADLNASALSAADSDRTYAFLQSFGNTALSPEMQKMWTEDIPVFSSHSRDLATLLQADAQRLTTIRLTSTQAIERRQLWRYDSLSANARFIMKFQTIWNILAVLLALIGIGLFFTKSAYRKAQQHMLDFREKLSRRAARQAAPFQPGYVTEPGSLTPPPHLTGHNLYGQRFFILLSQKFIWQAEQITGKQRPVFSVRRRDNEYYVYAHESAVFLNYQPVVEPALLRAGDLIHTLDTYLVFEL